MPFFCVHPVMGVVYPYYQLAHQLGKTRPFYGLQSANVDGKPVFHPSIEGMAANYVEAILEVTPCGPFALGGWSFGSAVAFEMAQQVRAAGYDVALLLIFDTPAHDRQLSWWRQMRVYMAMNSIIGRNLWPYVRAYRDLAAASSQLHGESANSTEQIQKNGREMQDAQRAPPLWRQPLIRQALRIYSHNLRLSADYVSKTYSGAITLFKATDQFIPLGDDLGWARLAAGGVRVISVPGNHMTFLRPPHVQVVAERLRETLNALTVN